MFSNDLVLGGIKVAEQRELTEFDQEAASASAALDAELNKRDLVGAPVYKIFSYVGPQVARGTNHVFLVEKSHLTSVLTRHILEVVVNEFAGNYTVVSQTQLY